MGDSSDIVNHKAQLNDNSDWNFLNRIENDLPDELVTPIADISRNNCMNSTSHDPNLSQPCLSINNVSACNTVFNHNALSSHPSSISCLSAQSLSSNVSSVIHNVITPSNVPVSDPQKNPQLASLLNRSPTPIISSPQTNPNFLEPHKIPNPYSKPTSLTRTKINLISNQLNIPTATSNLTQNTMPSRVQYSSNLSQQQQQYILNSVSSFSPQNSQYSYQQNQQSFPVPSISTYDCPTPHLNSLIGPPKCTSSLPKHFHTSTVNTSNQLVTNYSVNYSNNDLHSHRLKSNTISSSVSPLMYSSSMVSAPTSLTYSSSLTDSNYSAMNNSEKMQQMTSHLPNPQSRLSSSHLMTSRPQSNLASSFSPTSVNQSITNTPLTPHQSKLKMFRQQLVLLLHAHSCIKKKTAAAKTGAPPDQTCNLPHCETMCNVLTHLGACTEKINCSYNHCTTSRRIIKHWQECKRHECEICAPFILPSLQQSKSATQLHPDSPNQSNIVLNNPNMRRGVAASSLPMNQAVNHHQQYNKFTYSSSDTQATNNHNSPNTPSMISSPFSNSMPDYMQQHHHQQQIRNNSKFVNYSTSIRASATSLPYSNSQRLPNQASIPNRLNVKVCLPGTPFHSSIYAQPSLMSTEKRSYELAMGNTASNGSIAPPGLRSNVLPPPYSQLPQQTPQRMASNGRNFQQQQQAQQYSSQYSNSNTNTCGSSSLSTSSSFEVSTSWLQPPSIIKQWHSEISNDVRCLFLKKL